MDATDPFSCYCESPLFLVRIRPYKERMRQIFLSGTHLQENWSMFDLIEGTTQYIITICGQESDVQQSHLVDILRSDAHMSTKKPFNWRIFSSSALKLEPNRYTGRIFGWNHRIRSMHKGVRYVLQQMRSTSWRAGFLHRLRRAHWSCRRSAASGSWNAAAARLPR